MTDYTPTIKEYVARIMKNILTPDEFINWEKEQEVKTKPTFTVIKGGKE
jgi:hypothetical protein